MSQKTCAYGLVGFGIGGIAVVSPVVPSVALSVGSGIGGIAVVPALVTSVGLSIGAVFISEVVPVASVVPAALVLAVSVAVSDPVGTVGVTVVSLLSSPQPATPRVSTSAVLRTIAALLGGGVGAGPRRSSGFISP
jgi:hypothetical protein